MSLFNYELFFINGYPMKFFLDGYTDSQIHEMANIVEAFGGKFSGPSENTIVFSYPGCSSCRNHERFDSKFLYDSVTTGQLQKLDKYRLPSTQTEAAIKATENCSRTNPEMCIELDTHSADSENNSKKSSSANQLDKLSSSTEPGAAASSGRSSKSKETIDNAIDERISRAEDQFKRRIQIEMTKVRCKSSASGGKGTGGTEKAKNVRVNPPYSKEESTKILKFLDENKAACDAIGVSVWRKMDEAKIFVQPYRSRKSLHSFYCKKLRDSKVKKLEDEGSLDKLQKPIQDVHNKTSSSSQVNTAIKINENSVPINPRKCPTTNSDSTDSEDDSVNDSQKSSSSAAPEATPSSSERVSKSEETQNESIATIAAKIDMELTKFLHTENEKQLSKSLSEADQSNYKTGRANCIKQQIPYSKEESEKILKYVAEHKTDCGIRGVSLWRQMEAEKIFVNPYRSTESLRKFYFRHLQEKSVNNLKDEEEADELRKNIEYAKKIKLPKKQRYTRKRYIKYSKEDNQKIVDYIIKNERIPYVAGRSLWKQMEQEKILTNPPRSWQGMKSYFRSNLQNHIGEYTNDPVVLKAFEEGRLQRSLDFVERRSRNRMNHKSSCIEAV